jgi:DnaK suppressor protein
MRVGGPWWGGGKGCYDRKLFAVKIAPGVSGVMDEQHYKDALLRKRGEIVGTGGIKPLQATMENNTRQGDMADQASGNNEVHIQLKLKQTDAKILQAIEEALGRIDKGTYGVCRDCAEPIAEARLNAIPWTRVCITCKEKQNS